MSTTRLRGLTGLTVLSIACNSGLDSADVRGSIGPSTGLPPDWPVEIEFWRSFSGRP